MRRSEFKTLVTIGIIGAILAASIYGGYIDFTPSTVSTDEDDDLDTTTTVTIENPYNLPDGMSIDSASYIIFKNGTLTCAKNGTTGYTQYSGADTSSVIQNAIDNLGPEGGSIYIRAGYYELSDTIYIGQYVTLAGESATHNGLANFNLTGGQIVGMDMTGCYGSSLMNLAFNTLGGDTDIGILLSGGSFNKLSNIFIMNCSTGILFTHSIWNWLERVEITYSGNAVSLTNLSNQNIFLGGRYNADTVSVVIEDSNANSFYSVAVGAYEPGWYGFKMNGSSCDHNYFQNTYIETNEDNATGFYFLALAHDNSILYPRFNLNGANPRYVVGLSADTRNSFVQDSFMLIDQKLSPQHYLMQNISTIWYSTYLTRSDNINGTGKVAYFFVPTTLNTWITNISIYFATDDPGANCTLELIRLAQTSTGQTSVGSTTASTTGQVYLTMSNVKCYTDYFYVIKVTVNRSAGSYAYIYTPGVEGHVGYY